MTSPKIFFKIFKGRDLISLPYFYYPYCNKKSINFLIKRRTKMDTPIAAAIHTIEKKHLKNHLTIHSIWNCVIHCISPWLSFDTSFYHISVFLSKIFHFKNYIFYIFLHLLVVFLLKYDILFLTSCITEFLTHVYYTYYNIIIERGGILCQWNQKKW